MTLTFTLNLNYLKGFYSLFSSKIGYQNTFFNNYNFFFPFFGIAGWYYLFLPILPECP